MNSPVTPADALFLLKAGNARFVAGAPATEPYGHRVRDFAGDQSPFAAVLGCSDSRVPIETIFDQVPGKIFVVRVAGNFINDDNLGSLEFAVERLEVPLVVVLGHARCGAVTAGLAFVRDGTRQREHIQGIVEAMAPAVRAARNLPGDWLENAIAQNVALNATAIASRSKIVAEPVESGRVAVSGATYDVTSGVVTFL
ncbi:MAG TPA: carbonic anhydrase [Candidatus Cybelea sp.]